MNKTSRTLLALIVLCVTFIVGVKIGGYRGFKQGYDEGYRYDCKEEISAIYKRVKSQSGIVRTLRAQSIRNQFENDSLKNNEQFKQRQVLRAMYLEEAERRKQKYLSDSVKYYPYVVKYRDSLVDVYGLRGIVKNDGSPNLDLCEVWKLKAPECRPGWHISQVLDRKKSRKGRK